MSEVQLAETCDWFYEENGKRKGPFSENEISELIQLLTISFGTSVWRKGFAGWMNVENTELSVYLGDSEPPPLQGDCVNNTIVWILAFAPLIGYFLEWIIAFIVHDGSEVRAYFAMERADYWYVTLVLNVALAYIDSNRLSNAGYGDEKFNGWAWLVPVYLYQRAKATKQSLAYFIVWMVCIAVVTFG